MEGGCFACSSALQLIAFIRGRTVTRIKPFSVITTRFSALQRYIITIRVINPRDTPGLLLVAYAHHQEDHFFFVLGRYERGKLLASHNSAVYCCYITFASIKNNHTYEVRVYWR